jgi:hypothetical protein
MLPNPHRDESIFPQLPVLQKYLAGLLDLL